MTGLFNRLLSCVLAITIAIVSPAAAAAQTAPTATPATTASSATAKPAGTASSAPAGPGDPWPRVTTSNGATISIFQPQVDSWVGNQLKAFAAVRIKTATKQDTDYGVIWFSARTEVDKVNRMVTLDSFVLTKQSFPTIANNGSAYASAFIENLPWTRTIPLDMLESSLAVTNAADSQKKYERSAAHPVQHYPGGSGTD
jgi:hypothetical protein